MEWFLLKLNNFQNNEEQLFFSQRRVYFSESGYNHACDQFNDYNYNTITMIVLRTTKKVSIPGE